MLAGTAIYLKMQRDNQAKAAAATAAEQQFMQQMTAQHLDAIQMAQTAGGKAKNRQVKAIAAGIVAVQNKEVADMKSWYSQWFGRDMPAMAAMPGMINDGMDMGKLSTASDYDLEFVNQMIPHHQQAVEMAKKVLPQAKHPELKQLAGDVISTQTMEIQEMQQLQTEFHDYPIGSATRRTIDCGDDTPGC
ncbi:MAG: hypothetical protein NVSMB39_7740 [Candidatus Saccharimonadales bacterium]